MKQWNLIVDVANCTNCNLCVLAVQDEYCGNEFPGYAAEMPKHGHRWIEIKQKVRGKAPARSSFSSSIARMASLRYWPRLASSGRSDRNCQRAVPGR